MCVPWAVAPPAAELLESVAEKSPVWLSLVNVDEPAALAPDREYPSNDTISTRPGCDVTVTVADAVVAGSLASVAVTVCVPAVAGAVKTPEGEMVPPVALHVTPVNGVSFSNAVKVTVPLGATDAVCGVTRSVAPQRCSTPLTIASRALADPV